MSRFRLLFRARPPSPAASDAPPGAVRVPVPIGEALLAATIGHDIRNLLTAIGMAVEMAIDAVGDDHPARADLVEAIRTLKMAAPLTARLVAMGHGHGDATRVGPAHGPDRHAGSDIVEVVRAIEPILRRLLVGDWVLHLDIPSAVARVALDAVSIESLVVNLVVNARDAQPLGGRIDLALHVRRAARIRPATVELSVADRGTGIAPEVRDRLFEPRVTTKAHGSGLGLAIVADVVHGAGGTVAVSDQPDGGTRFVVTLPELDGRGGWLATAAGFDSPRIAQVRRCPQSIEGNP